MIGSECIRHNGKYSKYNLDIWVFICRSETLTNHFISPFSSKWQTLINDIICNGCHLHESWTHIAQYMVHIINIHQ